MARIMITISTTIMAASPHLYQLIIIDDDDLVTPSQARRYTVWHENFT